MIKFFRRIRQQLLKENQMKKPVLSRVEKYTLYAIGEILLVVIGILIALQVNNWNTQRKEIQLNQNNLSNLKDDAQDNLAKLDRYIQRAEGYVQKVDKLWENNEEKISKSDLDSIGIIRQTFFLKDDTYREMIANGQLKLVSEDVKKLLGDISSQFKSVNKIDEHNTLILNNQHLKMGEFFILKRLNRTSQYEVTINTHVDQEQALLVYKNYINFCYDWMKTQRYFYSEMKKAQLELIELLEK